MTSGVMCETLSANDEAWTLRPLDVQWPSLGTCPSTLWVVCGSTFAHFQAKREQYYLT